MTDPSHGGEGDVQHRRRNIVVEEIEEALIDLRQHILTSYAFQNKVEIPILEVFASSPKNNDTFGLSLTERQWRLICFALQHTKDSL